VVTGRRRRSIRSARRRAAFDCFSTNSAPRRLAYGASAVSLT